MTGVQSDVVWIDVLPSMSGFAQTLARGAAGAGRATGRAIAGELDTATRDAGRTAGENLGRGLDAGVQGVEKATTRLSTARDNQEKAAGAARVAELRLQEIVEKGDAPASRLAQAEEALATARRRVNTTTDAAALAAERVAQAERRAASGADNLGGSSRRAGSEVDGMGGHLDGAKEKIAGFAAGLGGIGLAYEAVSTSFEQGALGDKLAAQLGAPAKYSAELGKTAGKLYADAYGDSLSTVNDALRGVLQNGLVADGAPQKQIEGITASVLDLSTAFDQDVGGVTKAVGQAIKTGLAPNAKSALDFITRGFQNGADAGGDFLDTLSEYGVQFQKLGLDGATATGLISQGLKGGARDGDLVADAIKEFSLRAVDGSASSAAAFQGLGLDAQKMTEKIAAGGPQAKEGLGQVLDLLRGVEDPAKRAQLATGLFGTQAEDLGKALYSLDPTKAVGTLGQVDGAAKRMGETLNDNAQTKITTFQRSLQQGLVDFIGGQAIPAVQSFSGFLHENGQAILDGAVVVGALALAVGAYSLIQGGATVGLGAWILSLGVVRVATGLWAASQAFLNAVMAGNPLAIVVLAIAALVAAVIIAYQHSETFRAVVQAAWAGIQVAVGSVVAWFQTYALPVLQAVWSGIATGAMWLWTNVLAPTFSFIGAAFLFLVTGIQLTWQNVLSPVFQLVGAILKAVYDTVVAPVLGAMGAYFSLIFTGMKIVWETILRPVFSAVGTFIRDNVAPAFAIGVSAIGTAWNKLQDAAKTPVRFVVDKVINGALIGNFNKLADVFGTKKIPEVPLPAGFARGGILPGQSTIGDGDDQVISARRGEGIAISEAMAVPQLRGELLRWNALGAAGGTAALRRHAQRGFYSGGIVDLGHRFQGSGAQVSEHPAFGGVTPNAHVKGSQHYTGDAIDVNTRGGPASDLEKRELAPLATAAQAAGFSVLLNYANFPHWPGHDNHLHVGAPRNGIVGKIGDIAAGIGGAVLDPASAITGAIDKALGAVGDSPFAQLAAGVPRLLGKAAVDKLGSLAANVGDFFGGGDAGHGPVNQAAAGAGVQRWTPQVLEALHLVGQPDSLVQTTLRRMQQESGGDPRAINLTDINAKRGDPSKGLMQVIGSTFRANALPGHNTDIWDPVSNISASMMYALRQYKSLTKAYDRKGGYDDGGYLQPGVTQVTNATGKPEPVFTSEQWATLRAQITPGTPTSGPTSLTVVDVDGALIGRMRIEAGEQLMAMADDAYYAGV